LDLCGIAEVSRGADNGRVGQKSFDMIAGFPAAVIGAGHGLIDLTRQAGKIVVDAECQQIDTVVVQLDPVIVEALVEIHLEDDPPTKLGEAENHQTDENYQRESNMS